DILILCEFLESSMRTHIVAASNSSQRNTTVEETTSKRSTGRASKKKSTWIETAVEVKSPGGTRRSKRTGVAVGGNDFTRSVNSPEICILDEGGPAKRTRLSERTASECSPSTSSEVPRLRRSPRVHDTAEAVEVWRSPRRRGSGFMSSQIKQEPIDVEIDDVPSKPSESREEMATPMLSQRSPLLVQSLVEDREASDIHRREGSTETMAMCEEGSDRSLCDGENERGTEPVYAVPLPIRSIHAKSIKQSANAASTSGGNRVVINEKFPKIATVNSGGRISRKSEVKLDRRLSKLAAANESIVQRRKKKSEESQIATICSSQQLSGPSKAYSPRKKGYRHGVARTRDAPLESIPPLKPTPPEERMDIIIPEGDSVELSNEMIYNFAQCMPVPIGRNQFSSESVLEPLKRRLLMALRELIDGAKLFAMQARRDRIDHNDINAFIRHAHLPPLYEFMEDDNWLKIGDVFVPNAKPIQLSSLQGSVKVQTERVVDFKCTMVYANR
uniref:Uncharacterized protein n=1 Tax=Parascaris univalens TaxID=6257 RepID=A0A915CC07_PARUN